VENGPIFEWSPGEIIADPEDDIDMMTIEMKGVNFDEEEDDFSDARYNDGIIHDDDENGRSIRMRMMWIIAKMTINVTKTGLLRKYHR